MIKQIIFTIMVVFGGYASISAQQSKTLSGIVTDASTGEILIGVSVFEPSTTNGTVTDANGEYTLSISGNQVAFSYVGYALETLTVDKAGVMNVQLRASVELDEIVVIGYGTQRKSDLTGSISSITAKDVKNYVVSNISEALAGKAAGVSVMAPSGQPGDGAIIRIRGFGTVNDNNPLYVVDGLFMNNINSLNMADIERIEILKDASAAAIYGSRGSNGVILITTKKGVKGETEISLDAFTGITTKQTGYQMMHSEDYYNFIMEAYKDDASFDKNKFTGLYKRGYDTDWWNEVNRSALNQNYHLGIRKGTEDSRTALSLGYINNEGALITTGLERITLKLNQEYDFNKYITVGADIGMTKGTYKDAGALSAFNLIQKADPFTPVINPLVDPSSENYAYNKYAPTEWSWFQNPVAILNLTDRYTSLFYVFGNVFASFRLFDGLTYRTQYSFERNHDALTNFLPIYTSTFTENEMSGNKDDKSRDRTQLTKSSATTFNYIAEQRLQYNKIFGNHRIDAMLAMTYEKNTSESVAGSKRTAFGNDEAYRILDAHTTEANTWGGKGSSSMLSYMGRLNYIFADKYLLTTTLRADASSNFAAENRWGYFPSFSLGWRITNEDFFQKLNIEKIFSDAKIRVGWGQNGNQRINSQAALTLVGTDNNAVWYFGNGGATQGYYPSYAGNRDVKWEISQQTNTGIDAILLNHTLYLSMDYYIKETRGMLLTVPVPSFGAFPNWPWVNTGDLKNTGFEWSLNYRNTIGKDFSCQAGANISTYKTEVITLPSEYLSGSVSRTYVGGPIGRFYGYQYLGIFQNEKDIDSYRNKDGEKIQPLAAPGDFKFADLDGNGLLNDEDRTFIGDPNPDFIFGFNLGFTWKNFDFSAACQGVYGNDVWNVSKGLSTPGRDGALEEAYTKAWRKEGDQAAYPRITIYDNNT
jgi:TonB-linked SusC/RagA family outer membrane protein